MLKLFLNVTGPVLIEHNKLQNYANNINSISKQKWKEENIFFNFLDNCPIELDSIWFCQLFVRGGWGWLCFRLKIIFRLVSYEFETELIVRTPYESSSCH